MKSYFFMGTLAIVFSGCYDCLYFVKQFKKKKYHLIVKEKKLEHYKEVTISGLGLDGRPQMFYEVGFKHIYDLVQIGDTLVKDSGSADIKLFRKDTCIIQHCYCDGSVVYDDYIPAQQPLTTQLQQIAGKIKGKVGVSAMVIETGQSVSLNADGHYPMQSVYKFPIALAILQQVDKGKLTLDQQVQIHKEELIPRGHSPIRDSHPNGTTMTLREVLRYNVSESDGSACDVLLRLLGGAPNANKAIHQLGVNDIAIATTEKLQVSDEKVQYRNWCTPMAMTQLYKIFYTKDVLSASSKALLIKYMTETPTGMKRLKGLLPEGTVVIHKTGTSFTIEGFTAATNDTGIIILPNGKHLSISVFVSDAHGSTGEKERIIAEIAKACYDHWNS